MKTWRVIVTAIVCAVVCAGCGGSRLMGPMPTTTPVVLTFTPANQPILNPERGFYLPMELIGTDDFGAVRAAGYSLIHSDVRLDAYRERDLPPDFLDALDKALAAVREGGIKVVLRFMYNAGPYPNSEPDASKAQILRHIEQLTPALQKNADVIAWMEAGFIGAWGEWHTSTHGLDKSRDDKYAIVSALLLALPKSRMVQLRYPTDIMRLFGKSPLPESAAFTGSDMARIGHHNDCFLASDDDWGTYNRDGQNTRAGDQAYLAQMSRFTPTSGETCNVNPPRSNCPIALQELSLLHFSAINLSYHPGVVRGWRKQGCFDEISNRLGYHLTLKYVDYARFVQGNDVILRFEAKVKNTGFASPINPRPVNLVFEGRDGSKQVGAIDTDLRSWSPGEHNFSIDVKALPAGTYRVSLWLPDADPRLRADPRYAVHFDNAGMWDDATGYNVLTTDMVVK